ncbi:MAG: DNA recombination protein RmuC [Microbacteriaceae bacterium]
MEPYIFLAIGIAAGIAIGWLIARVQSPRAGADQALVAGLSATRDAQAIQIDDLKAQLEQLRSAEEARKSDESKVLQQLAPVELMLKQLSDSVRTMENERGTQFNAIDKALKQAREDAEKLTTVTFGLKSALGNANVRGHWGETQLRRVVEAAGLVEHVDFTTQVHKAGDDDSAAARPDMVINLPENAHIVVDSKAPLVKYMEAMEVAELGGDAKALLKEHARHVRGHVKTLADKKYWEKFSDTADYVILFLPSEAVLAEALSADPALYEDALKMNVALVSPNGMFTTLKSVAYIWRQHSQTEEVVKIVHLGQALFTSLGQAAAEVGKMGGHLSTVVQAYNDLVAKMEGGVLRAAKKFPGINMEGLKELAPIEKEPREIKTERFPEPLALSDGLDNSEFDEIEIDLGEIPSAPTMDTDEDNDKN